MKNLNVKEAVNQHEHAVWFCDVAAVIMSSVMSSRETHHPETDSWKNEREKQSVKNPDRENNLLFSCKEQNNVNFLNDFNLLGQYF